MISLRPQNVSSLLIFCALFLAHSFGSALARPSTITIERGEQLTEQERKSALAVQSLLPSKAKELDNQEVVLKGKVERVCQKKGCWFTLRGETEDEPVRVRITSKGYLFFVPKDTAGHHAVVKGTFSVKALSRDEAEHFAKDEGRDLSSEEVRASLPTNELQLAATGVVLTQD